MMSRDNIHARKRLAYEVNQIRTVRWTLTKWTKLSQSFIRGN